MSYLLFLFFTKLSFASPPIIGGEFISTQTAEGESVVAILSKKDGAYKPFCSGTLLNSRLVLTAAHCLAENSDEEIFIAQSDVPGTFINVQPAKSFKIYFKDYYELNINGTQDVALIRLGTPIELSHYPEIGEPEKLVVGQKVTQVGYGATELMLHRNEYGEEWSTHEGAGPLKMLTSNTITQNLARKIVVKQDEFNRIGKGDSGGPLFIDSSDRLTIHGIVSTSNRRTFNATYTHPYFFKTWINCSLPESERLSVENLSQQIPCDQIPFLANDEFYNLRKKFCEEQNPGYSLTINRGCYPVTQQGCENSPGLRWNAATNECGY